MSAPRCIVLGFGSWGQRVYDKLLALDAEVWSVDPNVLAADAAYVTDLDLEGITHAVVATPPHMHRLHAIGLVGLLPSLTDLRLEKPGCVSEDDLLAVVHHADQADVQVSVGYTLAADPMYLDVFDAFEAEAVQLGACRTSSSPARHDVSAMHDLGAHAAFLAAWFGVPAEIHAAHDAGLDARSTTLTLAGGECVSVMEQSRLVAFPDGSQRQYGPHDALRDELRAFLDGEPLVGSETAIDAHRVMAAQEVMA